MNDWRGTERKSYITEENKRGIQPTHSSNSVQWGSVSFLGMNLTDESLFESQEA
jgi:hypothetical protein